MQWLSTTLFTMGVGFSLAGLGLMACPATLNRAATSLYRKWHEADVASLLGRNHRIERPLYRHHRLFGALVILADAMLLAFLSKGAGNPLSSLAMSTGVRVALLLSWAVLGASLVVGVYLFIRPSALKSIEAFANRPVNLLRRTTDRGRRRLRLAWWAIERRPRPVGLVILLIGGLMLVLGAVV